MIPLRAPHFTRGNVLPSSSRQHRHRTRPGRVPHPISTIVQPNHEVGSEARDSSSNGFESRSVRLRRFFRSPPEAYADGGRLRLLPACASTVLGFPVRSGGSVGNRRRCFNLPRARGSQLKTAEPSTVLDRSRNNTPLDSLAQSLAEAV